jgi:hypothetical protein
MAKPGRNDLCSCGSGRKFKRCCATKTSETRSSTFLMIAVGAAVLAAVAAGVVSFTSERTADSTRVWDSAHGHYHNANGVQVP